MYFLRKIICIFLGHKYNIDEHETTVKENNLRLLVGDKEYFLFGYKFFDTNKQKKCSRCGKVRYVGNEKKLEKGRFGLII
jgi:hypothetical protein